MKPYIPQRDPKWHPKDPPKKTHERLNYCTNM